MGNTTYPLKDAARAAQMNERELRRHINNGIIKLQGYDRKSNGSGDPAGYSRRRILQAAIMKQMAGFGLPASKASAAALQFCDFGQTGRGAGDLFPTGKTLLILSEEPPVVINADFDVSVASLSPCGVSLTIIDINKIVASVDAALTS